MTWLVTFLPYLVAAVQVVASTQHNAALKSVHQASLECKHYLGDTNGSIHSFETCGSRGELLALRSWSDETGLVCDSYQRYFRPTCDDLDYRNRTRACIESSWSSDEDICFRADVAARCCREQYGFLESRSPKMLRMPEVLVVSNLRQCAQILGVSRLEFKLFQGFWFQFSEKARRLLRCLVMRQGLLGDVLDRDGVYLQYSDNSVEKEDFEEDFQTCVDRVRADQYRQVARTMFHCIPRNDSIKFDLVDLLPARLPELKCREVFQTKCRNACSLNIVANLCYDAEQLTEDSLNEALNSLDINEEGLLLPSVELSELLPKEVAECVTTWLSECLEDCSSHGIQVICSLP